GEARLKSYGVEWRVPSSAWVHSEDGRSTIWNMVEKAFNLFAEGRRLNPAKNGSVTRLVNSASRNSTSLESYLLPLPEKPAKKVVVKKTVAKKVTKTTKTVSRKLTLESMPF
ncbi:MAG: hypothetical protein KAH32_09060, partial [Chlamydiia bacterium]|nr:hypothetical protein [Chlamydiia bacterium]